jgi:hypothetical protein
LISSADIELRSQTLATGAEYVQTYKTEIFNNQTNVLRQFITAAQNQSGGKRYEAYTLLKQAKDFIRTNTGAGTTYAANNGSASALTTLNADINREISTIINATTAFYSRIGLNNAHNAFAGATVDLNDETAIKNALELLRGTEFAPYKRLFDEYLSGSIDDATGKWSGVTALNGQLTAMERTYSEQITKLRTEGKLAAGSTISSRWENILLAVQRKMIDDKAQARNDRNDIDAALTAAINSFGNAGRVAGEIGAKSTATPGGQNTNIQSDIQTAGGSAATARTNINNNDDTDDEAALNTALRDARNAAASAGLGPYTDRSESHKEKAELIKKIAQDVETEMQRRAGLAEENAANARNAAAQKDAAKTAKEAVENAADQAARNTAIERAKTARDNANKEAEAAEGRVGRRPRAQDTARSKKADDEADRARAAATIADSWYQAALAKDGRARAQDAANRADQPDSNLTTLLDQAKNGYDAAEEAAGKAETNNNTVNNNPGATAADKEAAKEAYNQAVADRNAARGHYEELQRRQSEREAEERRRREAEERIRNGGGKEGKGNDWNPGKLH